MRLPPAPPAGSGFRQREGGIAFFPSSGMSPNWRSWIGYTGANALGLRLRYWEFDHLVTNTVNAFTYGFDG
jgi:hypothetical protein